MAIQIVCPGCHKRFKVSDQFAGKKGPCPECKTEINIPAADEQVVVHAPEGTGPKDSTGKVVLQPIARSEAQVSAILWASIIGGVVLVLALALIMRFSVEDKSQFPIAILILGAIALGPPVAVAGYAFLRDDELEPYGGVELWIRASICGAIYSVIWALYAWAPGVIHLEELETYQLAVWGSVIACLGAVAPLAIFDFEYLMGLVHYGLYVLVCIVLCLLMGYYGFMHTATAS